MGYCFIMYQFVCILFFLNLSHITSSTPPLCPPNQSFSLLQFKNSFTFDSYASEVCGASSYPKMKSWKKGRDCCSWDGVTCDRVTGHVIGLDLSCSWLQGSIYSNSSLFLLPHLQRINFACNDLRNSEISPMFARFSSLTHLNLSRSQFSGEVPSEISHLSKLVSLDLSFNSFTVTLEHHTFNSLVHNLTRIQQVFLDYVDMSSVVPSSFTNLSSSLTHLSLSVCLLEGKFPDDIFSSLINLQTLDLSNNNLHGYFPKFNWSSPLKFLDLSFTSFSGELPRSIGNLKSLNHLGISNCGFIGTVPASLGNLTQLIELDLSDNNFTGQIPDTFGSIKNLESLIVSHNDFGGQLPSSIFNLTQIVSIDMSYNQLVGPMDYPIIHLPNLKQLSLSLNSLNGTMPSWLFALPSLVSLDMHKNQITGSLSEFQYNSLELIDLSNNKLHGPIPTSIFKLVNLSELYLSSNNLSGNIDLDMLFSNFKNLSILYLSNNSLSVSTNSNVTSNCPQLRYLGLSFCKISEFPYFLRTSKKLEQLDLSNNIIHGQIPKWMLELGKDSLSLLQLSNNFLTGGLEQIPWNIEYLDLHSNLLQGSLPNPPPSLIALSISNNRLTGEIPSSFCNMSSLKLLDLSNNSFSGEIPRCFGNFSDDIWVLNLRMNRFHGIMPQTFRKCQNLEILGLNGNVLDGPLPQSLVNCKKLQVLDLGDNKINGTFPHWLETFPKLQVLILRSNHFYGPIGNSRNKIAFPELRIFDVSNNRFTGLLPSKYISNMTAMMHMNKGSTNLRYMGSNYGGGNVYHDSVMVTMKGSDFQLEKILTIFTSIDLSNNSFRGEIPSNIGKLNALKGLNMSHNNLTGRIPSLLGNLTDLEWLDLSSNNLVGEIPRELADLTYLAVLNLSQNRLVGSIPRGKQFDTFNSDSYEGNSGLCGFPLPNSCAPPQPPPQEEDDSKSRYGFSWKMAFMGYGCGTVFGLSMGYILLSSGRPQWLLQMVEGAASRLKIIF